MSITAPMAGAADVMPVNVVLMGGTMMASRCWWKWERARTVLDFGIVERQRQLARTAHRVG